MSATEIQNTIGVLRALIVSQKNPTKIRDLLRDYREMEGQPIQFKKFGFHNVEDFLKSSHEFCLMTHQGEVCVTARPTKESAHISEMVARQKTRKKRRSTSNYFSFRTPTRSSDQSWNKSSFSNIYRRMNQNNNSNSRNTPRERNFRLQGDSNNNVHQNNNRNLSSRNGSNLQQKIQSNERINIKSQSIKENDLRNKLDGNRNQMQQKYDLRNKLDANRNQIQQKPNINLLQSQPDKKKNEKLCLLDIEASKPNKIDDLINLKIEVCTKSYGKINSTRNVIKKDDKNNNPKLIQNKKLNQSTGNKTSVQDRLKIIYPTSTCIQESTVTTPVTAPSLTVPLTPNKFIESVNQIFSTKANLENGVNTESTVIQNMEKCNQKIEKKINNIQPIIRNENYFEFNNNLNSVQALEDYCKAKKYEMPHYEKIKSKYGKSGIQCRVSVNGVMYSTYPKEFNDIVAAQIACAKIAIDEIQFIMSNKNRYPVWSNSDSELVNKIYDDIKENHRNGIFMKLLPKIFEETYQTILPDHWISLINDSNQFLMEDTAGGDKIILINENGDQIDANSSEFCEEIKLPWEEKHWNLYVTNCTSTTEIWARIVGPEYNQSLDALTNDIELAMLTKKQRPSSIATGQFYLVCLSECWHRVRLEQINKEKRTCSCFFIDFGDEDVIPIENLFICDRKFLELPPQAIVFSLFGLEDFAENPIAKQHLIDILMGKSLVAEIVTKKDVFDKNCDENSAYSINIYNLSPTIPKIQIVLYDTSDATEDINLNPLLIKKISDETPPPELKRGSPTNVTITYITDVGDVFLQIRNAGLLYIQKLINQLVDSKFIEDHHKVTLEDILKTNIFLIRDKENNKWYRGSVAEDSVGRNQENYDIYYVDYGITKLTHVSQIFRLESLSAALSKFPKQAIKVKLHNIPIINKTVVGRIKALLPIDYPAIAKLVDLKLDGNRNLIPYIVAYVRFEHNSSLINVNESIKIEHELECSSEVSIHHHFAEDFTARSTSITGKSISTIDQIQNHIQSLPLPLPELPTPDVEQYFNVFVTVSSNPFNFLVRPYDNFPNFQHDMDKLKDYCFERDEYILNDMIKVGEIYVYVAHDGICSRVEVEGSYSPEMSCVVKIDYGDVIVVHNSQLRVLPKQFRNIPKQATKAILHGIKPIHGDWTTDDCMRFRELTVGQKFVSIIKKVSFENSNPKKHPNKVIELVLIDVETSKDIFIHTIFVDEKRALPV